MISAQAKIEAGRQHGKHRASGGGWTIMLEEEQKTLKQRPTHRRALPVSSPAVYTSQ